MRVLLDTHYLLWWLGATPELGAKARDLISEPANLIFYSVASLWELRIKEGVGKLVLPDTFTEVLIILTRDQVIASYDVEHIIL